MKTAVVTGGSRGIGRAISLELASGGARIVLTCLSDVASAEDTAAEIRRSGAEALALRMDVRNPEEVAALADRVSKDFGGAEIVVNNAGVIKDALFPFMKEEDWDFVLDVDLKGAFRVTRALIRGMLHKGWGRIINIVSVSGISGHAGQANYSAAKGGLIAFTKAIALELAPRGITCNAVARASSTRRSSRTSKSRRGRNSWAAFRWRASAGPTRSPRWSVSSRRRRRRT